MDLATHPRTPGVLFFIAAQHHTPHRKGSALSNPFVHLELSTPDLTKAKEFYASMFGWTYTDNDMDQMGIYSTFKPDTGPGEGMYSMLGSPTFWLPYIGVEEIKSATEKAVSLGAQFHMGPHEIPQVVWMTILVDPTGATIAIFQPTQPM